MKACILMRHWRFGVSGCCKAAMDVYSAMDHTAFQNLKTHVISEEISGFPLSSLEGGNKASKPLKSLI